MKFKYLKKYTLLYLFISFFCYIPLLSNSQTLEAKYPAVGKSGALSASAQLPEYIKYIYEAGIYFGFGIVILSFVWAGLLWILSSVNASLRTEAKDRFTGSLSGLLLLLFTYLIITTINPNLKILSLDTIPEQNIPVVDIEDPGGVYVNWGKFPYTTSTADLGKLKNRIEDVEIVDHGGSYMAIFYENLNLQGKCQYVNYNASSIPWASSMSVHTYDFEANGDGVYFFRKACFNKLESQYGNRSSLVNQCKQKSDGYLKISNGDIGSFYVAKLSDLEFENVPEEEKLCIKYDENYKCTERETPTLAGRNISSMIVNGNYLVLFVYFSPDDDEYGPWTFCQEFPTLNDVNKMGAYQIKWDAVMNTSGTGTTTGEIAGSVLPNFVIIVPIN